MECPRARRTKLKMGSCLLGVWGRGGGGAGQILQLPTTAALAAAHPPCWPPWQGMAGTGRWRCTLRPARRGGWRGGRRNLGEGFRGRGGRQVGRRKGRVARRQAAPGGGVQGARGQAGGQAEGAGGAVADGTWGRGGDGGRQVGRWAVAAQKAAGLTAAEAQPAAGAHLGHRSCCRAGQAGRTGRGSQRCRGTQGAQRCRGCQGCRGSHQEGSVRAGAGKQVCVCGGGG